MGNVSNNIFRENQNIFYVQQTFLFENPAVYEIMWKNTAEQDRPQMTIMAHAQYTLDN
jgi:hypothetical protein